MTTSIDSTPHLDDAELARLLDNEHAPDERARWDAHVAGCAQCTGEVDRLRADADVVRVWLERAAFEQPVPRATARVDVPRARMAPWLRAAAVVALVALPVTAIAAIPTLRAWLVAAIADVRDDDNPGTTTSQPAPDATVDDRIRFVPAAGNFTVQLDAAQQAGILRIAHGTDAAAVLDLDGTPTVVSETTLHIRNTAASARSYVLHLPLTVTSVTVRIGARTIAEADASDLRSGVEIPVRLR